MFVNCMDCFTYWLSCPRPTKRPTNKKKKLRADQRPLLHLGIPSTKGSDMENYNGDCAYANGLPVSVDGVDVVMPRTSDTKGTLSTQIGLHLRTIRLVWRAINALGGRRKTWRPMATIYPIVIELYYSAPFVECVHSCDWLGLQQESLKHRSSTPTSSLSLFQALSIDLNGRITGPWLKYWPELRHDAKTVTQNSEVSLRNGDVDTF
jgi:hypothetical protein